MYVSDLVGVGEEELLTDTVSTAVESALTLCEGEGVDDSENIGEVVPISETLGVAVDIGLTAALLDSLADPDSDGDVLTDAIELSDGAFENEASGDVVEKGERLIKDDGEILADPLALNNALLDSLTDPDSDGDVVPDTVKVSDGLLEYEASGDVVEYSDGLIKDDADVLADPLVLANALLDTLTLSDTVGDVLTDAVKVSDGVLE